MHPQRPTIAYGAVYYRRSNPPEADWERDYAQAAADGMNTFRHWFMWSAIEVEPGVYDWDKYDRQLDLAAQNGIQTIIAERVTFAPEWAYRVYQGCELRSAIGAPAHSSINPSSATGGNPGLCLDHPQVLAAAERFLVELARRYKDHPGLGGYDLWNECNIPGAYCYCEATVKEFRAWLQRRYDTPEAVGRRWGRYSIAEWEDVHPPVNRLGYAESLDWLRFRIDHAQELLRWRAETVRSVDSEHTITAHGIAASLFWMAENATDDWRSAAEVDSYGLTWVTARKGGEPWRQWNAIDLVRSASRGKPFWHAEMQGGPLWLQPQVLDRPREDGRIPTPEDIRLWNLVSMAGGATGVQYLRWRPLLDGPLFDAFGPYGRDGLPTPRSEMVSTIARWANDPEQRTLWEARPAKGDVGILMIPDAELLDYVQLGDATRYRDAMWGAYRGFFDLGLQPDYVRIEDIDDYAVIYAPMPIVLTPERAERLRTWVEAGGILVSEGCPGYFGEEGRVQVEQPAHGLAALFGAVESDVEFVPDLLTEGPERVLLGAAVAACGVLRQRYRALDGSAIGTYDDGTVAAVSNASGRGRTLLVGTSLGAGYQAHDGRLGAAAFRWMADWAGLQPRISVDGKDVTVRLHEAAGTKVVWIVNSAYDDQLVAVDVPKEEMTLSSIRRYRGPGEVVVDGQTIRVRVGARDAAVLGLQ